MTELVNNLIEAPLRRTGETLRILAETSTELRQNLRGQMVTCSDRCAGCCRQAVSVSYLEAVEMVREARKQSFFIDRMALEEDARKAAKLSLDEPEGRIAWFNRGRPCTFQRGMSCAVYRARPLQCRLQYVRSPATECSRVDGVVQRYDTAWTGEKAFARLAREHLDNGCTPIVGPLPIMIRAVLDGTPTSEIAKWKGSIPMVGWDERDAAKAADARRLGRTRAQAKRP